MPREQAAVFAHECLENNPPTDSELETAAKGLPSNGKSLQELLNAKKAG